jgi:hypothetical protein
MVNKLFSRLQKPALWQRSYELIWDDEHISKGMLEAHLNPNWDAASRKHSYIDRSAKWLESIIPSDSDGNISRESTIVNTSDTPGKRLNLTQKINMLSEHSG